MREIEACFDEWSRKTEDAFGGAEDDLVQVRNHLEGLADDEHDGDGDQHDAELVLLSLLLKAPTKRNEPSKLVHFCDEYRYVH